jgi:hypothetical protein
VLSEIAQRVVAGVEHLEICDPSAEILPDLEATLSGIAAHPNIDPETATLLLPVHATSFASNLNAAMLIRDPRFHGNVSYDGMRRMLRAPSTPSAVVDAVREISTRCGFSEQRYDDDWRNRSERIRFGARRGCSAREDANRSLAEDAERHVSRSSPIPFEGVVDWLNDTLRARANAAEGAERHAYVEWTELDLGPAWVGGPLPYPEPEPVLIDPPGRDQADQHLVDEATGPITSPDRLRELIRASSAPTLLAIARSPTASGRMLAEIISQSLQLRLDSASYPTCISPVPHLIAAVIQHPNTPCEALLPIVESKYLVLRRAARQHVCFANDAAAREKMITRSREAVRREAGSPPADGYPFPVSRFLSGLFPDMPVLVWKAFVNSSDWMDKLSAAMNPILTLADSATQDRLRNDGNQWIRSAARWRLANPDTALDFDGDGRSLLSF